MGNFLGNFFRYYSLRYEARAVQLKNFVRQYEGATKSRRTDGWHSTSGDPNKEIVYSLSKLRERSKDLRKNNPYASKAVRNIANNTTGTGIIPAIKNAKVKRAWETWADSTYCDFDEKMNFYGLQNLVMKCIAGSGECIVKRIRTTANAHPRGVAPLELQVLDGQYLDAGKNEEQWQEGHRIIGGVEFDGRGKKIAYWIFPSDPTECIASERILARDVLHIFDVDDPGQVRGVPFATPSIITLRDFDEYSDAQLVKQKVAACFAAFVTDANEGIPNPMNGMGGKSAAPLERIEPGIIENLPAGKTVTFANPPTVDGYGEYSRQTLGAVAAGFGGMSYESFTGDLSNVNFSSGRMGWIDFQRNIESWQWFMLIPGFCRRVFDWFVEAADLAGLVPDNVEQPQWTAPRRQMIDPVKETAGLLAQVRAGLISWQEALRSMGYQPEEILAELKKSKDLFDKAGIQPECDPRYDAQKIKQILDDADKDNKDEKNAKPNG